MGDTVKEIEDGVALASKFLPQFFGLLSLFFPKARLLMPFIPAMSAAATSVKTVMDELPGHTPAMAAAVVVDHLTPGAPNAAPLSRDSISTG